MEKIKIGTVVKSKKIGTEHVVESIELIDGKFFVFTEDIKCFPFEDLIYSDFDLKKSILNKVIENEKLDDTEFKFFENQMDKLGINLVVVNQLDIESYIRNLGRS